ncbi:hypothetical protein C8J57DRAFT_1437199 [Mycena rebaudengoi]|nr:hypothetical protein C8J57DRAFT_1437199 [Mycena rebaudengoi]
MPARGDRNAPQFDSSKPHELRRYFADLEYLLNRAAITDDTEKKMHATRFLSVEDQEIWEALDSFSTANQTYRQFKSAVLKLYAGNDEERRFELADLDAIIGQYSRVGILSMDDLTTFYRQFLRITTYLIQKNRLSAAEQSRSFLRAMQPPAFALEVKQRLQIKKPDVHPADPYALADIYAAAEFVLAGSGSTLALASHSTPAASTSTPATIEVKPDPGIAALVSTMAKLIEVLATQKTSDSNFNVNGNNGGQKRTRPDGCGYCSDLNHFINDCELVLDDIKAGKCKRNSDNRVVLPSGAFVPRTITGRDLRSRIERWHELNPGQLAAAQLMVEVAVEHLSTPASSSPMPLPRLPRNQLSLPPIRPLTPSPTLDRNAGLPTAGPSKAGPAYRSTAPVYNEKDAAEVFESTLDTPVTITQRQLLSIAPEVRSHMREVTTARRAPPKDNKNTGAPASQFLHDVETCLPFSNDSPLEFETMDEQHTRDARRTALLDSLPASYTNSAQVNLPAGGIVVPDPYSVYYDSGVIPDDLIVSMESSAIRSILPVIDNQQQIECIVDGGSQIIAMAEAVCHELALSYDPRIILRMQSANGSVNPSLGLARNVPFRIGDITLYLQVHIVRNPAYDVLLGRPFDVLTQSIVRNFANEDQTITICDPNSGKLATVPTVPRGPPRHRQQGFPNSRN